jgi:hypothetical protein
MPKKIDKLIDQIEAELKIKYPSSGFVEEIFLYLKEKGMKTHPTVNITIEQSDDDFLKINVEGKELVEPFLEILDTLLIRIREKEEIVNEKKPL